MSNFKMVSAMNEAFGNPKGNPHAIPWGKVAKQCRNIFDEYCELLQALGVESVGIESIKMMHDFALKKFNSFNNPNLEQVRDSLCDIHVFAYGAHHFMGIDADRDMKSVIDGVMTRFIKNEADKEATIRKHAAKGITQVYFEGAYPTMIMKSLEDQPDAPQGKFLKSASYKEPVFYDVTVKPTLSALHGIEDQYKKAIEQVIYTTSMNAEARTILDSNKT